MSLNFDILNPDLAPKIDQFWYFRPSLQHRKTNLLLLLQKITVAIEGTLIVRFGHGECESPTQDVHFFIHDNSNE